MYNFSQTWLRRLLVAFLVMFLWVQIGSNTMVKEAIAAPNHKMLALGGLQPSLNQTAPEFTLPTNSGDGKISLADYRGQWVVLYFYPKDFTSGCTLEAQRFQKDLPKYQEINTQILGVSVDDVDSHAEFCDSEGLTFPLLADTTGSVSKQYGSWLAGMSMRHTYLIDPNGILRDIFLGVNPVIHSQEVLSRLQELQINFSLLSAWENQVYF